MGFDHRINLQDLQSENKQVNKDPATQFLNVFVKCHMRDMKYVEIGKNSHFYV